MRPSVGGLVPWLRWRRVVHVVDGATYQLDVTWWRRRFLFQYDTPKIPKKIQRERDAEMARVRAVVAELLARQEGAQT